MQLHNRVDFVEQYVLPLLYPAHLTRSTQFALGTLVVVVNVAAYWYVWTRSARAR